MANHTFGVTIRPDAAVDFGPVPTDLFPLQRLVGGYLESIHLGPDAHAYVNEDGAAQGLRVNVIGTAALHIMRPDLTGQQIHGTIVFLGAGDNGTEGRLPDRVTRLLQDLVFAHSAPGLVRGRVR